MTAQYADFIGGGSVPLPKAGAVKAPPRSSAQAQQDKRTTERNADARRREEIRQQQTETWNRNAGYRAERDAEAKWQREYEARMRTEDSPEAILWRARHKKISAAGVDWGLIPMGVKVIGTGAAVIASGGAVAGALGVTAAGSAVAGATLASKAIDAVSTAQQVASAVKRGDVAKVAGVAAAKGGDVINIKANVKVPKLPAVAKPIAATAKAVAKDTKAAVKAVQKTSAAKVKAPTASAVVKAVANAKPPAKPPAAKPKPSVAAKPKPPAAKPKLQLVKPPAAYSGSALMGGKGQPRPLTVAAQPKPPAFRPVAAPPAASSGSSAPPTVKAGATSLPKGARGFFVPVAGAQKGVAVYVGA